MAKNFLKYYIVPLCTLLVSCSNLQRTSENITITDDKIYLDSAASTQIKDQTIQTLVKTLRITGNSNGVSQNSHYMYNIEQEARKKISKIINANPNEITFTSGATESNNLAIIGIIEAHFSQNQKAPHVISSKIEHASVLKTLEYMQNKGCRVTLLDVDQYGFIKIDELLTAIDKNTVLVSIQSVNNELGTIQHIEEIGKICKKHNIIFHTDASQAFGKIPLDIQKMDIDAMTISGHKIGAPQGIGALFLKSGIKCNPIMHGGNDDDLRPGSRPTALIAAFGKAAELVNINAYAIEQKAKIIIQGLEKIDNVKIHTPDYSSKYIILASIRGIFFKDLIALLPQYSLSSGSACAHAKRSHVINAIDPNFNIPMCVLRISYNQDTPNKYLQNFVKDLKEAVEKLRSNKLITELM